MPANILADMNTLSAGLEDQRALQIALELTKLGLNHQNNNQSGGGAGNNDSNNHHQHHGDGTPPTSASTAPTSTTVASGYDRDTVVVVPEGSGAAGGGGGGVVGSRKSANMTECVPVPSSEHVAEIVGRQGCKIKALRAKTNTYIKTPVRGEEPVFVVTGRKEDVAQAKREILSAAEHFSQIRASRRNNNAGSGAGGPAGLLPGPGNPNLPGQVTIQVRVPYRVVGLVVGPKGATIKRIQQQTHTYIVTPNRDKEPIFEVTGLPDSVEKARQEIEGHIAMRTGAISAGGTDASLNNHINNLHSGGVGNLNVLHGAGTKGGALDDGRSTDFQTNGIDAGFHELTTNIMFGSLYNGGGGGGGGGGNNGTGGSGTGTGGSGGANSSSKLHAGLSSAFTPYSKAPAANNSNNQSNNLLSQHLGGDGSSVPHDGQVFPFSAHHLDTSLPKYSDVGVLTTSSAVGLYDSDEGIGGSPTFDSATAPLALPSASIWSDLSSDSQGSDFGALFTGMNSHQRHLAALDSSPCVSLPQLSFGALAPSSADLTPTMATDQECVRRINSDPLNLATTLALLQNASGVPSPGAGGSTLASTCTSVCSSLSLSESAASSLHSGSASSSPTEPTATALVAPSRPRHCVLCGDGDVTSVPVPCGHNAFCKDCAEKLVRDNADSDGRCPICQQAPSQAIRIFS